MAVLSYNEITLKKVILWDDEPFIVLASHVFRKQKRKPVNVTKLKSLISGRVVEETFHASDTIEEAEIDTRPVEYIYESKGEYWFNTQGSQRSVSHYPMMLWATVSNSSSQRLL